MKKWAIPLAAAAAIAVVAVAGGVFALSDSGDDQAPSVSRDEGGGKTDVDGSGGDVAGIWASVHDGVSEQVQRDGGRRL